MRGIALKRRIRRRPSRTPALVTDFRAPLGAEPRYISRQWAAEADERDAAQAIAAVPEPDWAIPAPAAQQAARREHWRSGPQPSLNALPDGARPAEDVPQSWPQEQNPYPEKPQPSFTPHAAERRQRGSRHTQEWTPEFARHGSPVRPYAPRNQRIHPLPPATPMFFAPGDQEIRRRQVAAAQERVGQVRYPEPDAADQYGLAGAYAAMARHYDLIFGTRTPSSVPGGRWDDGRPAWLAPSAPEVPCRGLAITAGDAA